MAARITPSFRGKAMACSVEEKVASNALLTAASPTIPSKVALMAQRQHGLITEGGGVKANADAIVADAAAIRDECRASVLLYQDAMHHWNTHDYTKAIEDLQTIIDNAEAVVRDVNDMQARGTTIRDLIVGPLPAVIASAAAIAYKLLHR